MMRAAGGVIGKNLTGSDKPPPPDMFAIATLADVLRRNRDFHAAEPAYIFRHHDGTERGLSWGELWASAARLAAGIADRFGVGRKLMLVIEPGLQFVELFFAIGLAGSVPVPMSSRFGAGSVQRLRQVCAGAGIDGLIFDAANEKFVADVLQDVETGIAPATIRADLLAASSPAGALPDPSPIAFVQYTSGSTGAPRGLTITHANLLRNLSLMAAICEAKAGEKTVSWLPPHHDFGLIGGILFPAYLCGTAVLFSPTSFVRRPGTWLELISRYRAAFTGSPNFGFDLATRRAGNIEGLDLTSLRAAINGAERVDPETLRNFGSKFSAAGLDPGVVRPCYGLAEATLLVAGARAQPWRSVQASRRGLEEGRLDILGDASDPGNAVELVANGPPVVDDLIIVKDGEVVPDGRVGEIWIADACVSATAQKRSLDADPSSDWIATGDLGVLFEGELFIVGRAKDLVIRAGVNVYLGDVDAVVARMVPAGGISSVCAFRVPDTEEIAIFIEQKRSAAVEPMLIEGVHALFHATFGFTAFAVRLVHPGDIPRTTSGKKQRHLCAPLLDQPS